MPSTFPASRRWSSRIISPAGRSSSICCGGGTCRCTRRAPASRRWSSNDALRGTISRFVSSCWTIRCLTWTAPRCVGDAAGTATAAAYDHAAVLVARWRRQWGSPGSGWRLSRQQTAHPGRVAAGPARGIGAAGSCSGRPRHGGVIAADLAILLVEDHAINRRLAQIVLEREGHKVVCAENGRAALEALRRGHFDLVLMDLQMPHMDGIETTRAIREREKITGEHVPIIALTARAMAGDRERCLAAGMDGYLTKPLHPASLLKAIGRPAPSPEQPAPPAVSKTVLDRAALVDRVDGDPQLLEEIVELFFKNYGRLMADARDAMTARDVERFGNALHTLVGMFRNLAALAAQDLTEMLEAIDLAREPERAATIWVMLEQEVQALNAELASLVYERSAAGSAAA